MGKLERKFRTSRKWVGTYSEIVLPRTACLDFLMVSSLLVCERLMSDESGRAVNERAVTLPMFCMEADLAAATGAK